MTAAPGGATPGATPAGPVAVIGGGRMGSGIAHAYLLAGAEVRLVEASPTAMETAQERIAKLVQASAERGLVSDSVKAVLTRLSGHAEVAAVQGARLVIEAVPEDPALKAEVLSAADRALGPEALLGTNTSSISINELAACTTRPDRLLGLHFFNPVPASKLVEIVRGAATSQQAVEEAQRWVDAIGKRPIVVADSPGFASSRLGLALGLEAIRMVESGVASAEDIDAAMTLGYKHPVGPLRLTDMVGLDVRLGIATYLQSRLGARFEPPALLREMVAAGKLGQKSGQGFYTW